MSRIGFADVPESVETIKKIAALPNVEIEGMFTHFARADETDKTPAVDTAEPLSCICRASRKSGSTDSDETLLQQCRVSSVCRRQT